MSAKVIFHISQRMAGRWVVAPPNPRRLFTDCPRHGLCPNAEPWSADMLPSSSNVCQRRSFTRRSDDSFCGPPRRRGWYRRRAFVDPFTRPGFIRQLSGNHQSNRLINRNRVSWSRSILTRCTDVRQTRDHHPAVIKGSHTAAPKS